MVAFSSVLLPIMSSRMSPNLHSHFLFVAASAPLLSSLSESLSSISESISYSDALWRGTAKSARSLGK